MTQLTMEESVYIYILSVMKSHTVSDDEGRNFDAKGNLNAMAPGDSAKFVFRKAQLIVDQFNNYKVLDTFL